MRTSAFHRDRTFIAAEQLAEYESSIAWHSDLKQFLGPFPSPSEEPKGTGASKQKRT